MLNRKLSNYIYYGVVSLVIIIIFVVRIILLGSVNNNISDLEQENIKLQQEITALNEIVQDNSTSDSSQIYDLNKYIPNVYSGETLSNKIYSKLDRLGINESYDYNRSVTIDESVNLNGIEQFQSMISKYGCVEIEITFAIDNIDDIYSLLDSMNDDDQLFILNRVTYSLPEDDEFVNVTMSYYAFYYGLIETADEQ